MIQTTVEGDIAYSLGYGMELFLEAAGMLEEARRGETSIKVTGALGNCAEYFPEKNCIKVTARAAVTTNDLPLFVAYALVDFLHR